MSGRAQRVTAKARGPERTAIVIRTLGPLEVQVKGGPPPPELLWRRPLALLVYLARSPRGARTREHLVGLVWPDHPAPKALHSLSEALRIIRKSGGKQILTTSGNQVRLAAGAVDLDVDRFTGLAHAKRWGDASALVAGQFLDGFAVPGSSGLEDWLRLEREHWTREGVTALVNHAQLLLDAGTPDVALREARRAAELDPLSDAAARLTIRALALTGQQADALQAYDRFAARVAEAVGAGPDPDTTALAARVRRARAPRALRATTPAKPASARRPPLVGRTRELGQVLAAWERCRSTSRATAVIILGDAGTGKTRLADEVTERARLDGAVVAAARAVGGDLEEAWSGLLALADGGLIDAPGVPVAPPAAVGALAARLPSWAERFPGAAASATPPGRAFRDVVRAACAEQPVVLLLDDAQWLDRESLQALHALPRDLAKHPVFVVWTATAYPARAELDDLRSHVGRDVPGVALSLRPLAHDDVLALARWALPAYDAPALERVTRRVATDSASLPLLAVELLDAVAAGLDLGHVGGAWPEPLRTLEQTMPGDFPDAVVGAIRVNFRRLPPDGRSVLEALAALGNRVPTATLGRATGLTQDALHAALDELEWLRWVTSDARGYTFVARVVGTIVGRDMVTPGQRARLRERAAG